MVLGPDKKVKPKSVDAVPVVVVPDEVVPSVSVEVSAEES